MRRVLVVDDEENIRLVLRTLLKKNDYQVEVAESAEAALEKLERFDPDFVLADVRMTGMTGIELCTELKARSSLATVILMSAYGSVDLAIEAIKAGAAAFLLKDIGPEDLVTIIRRVNNGEYLINDKVFARPSVANRVLKEFRELAVYGQEAAPIFAPLSPREVEILDNIAKGMTNKQVAYALSISEQTVKNHMSSILRKLSVNDRTQAVVYAMKQGWIRIPED